MINNFKDKINEREVRVLRNKEQIIISHQHVLVGDILIISSGDITIVDGIIIKTASLAIQNKDGRIHEIRNLNYANNDRILDFPILLSGTRIIQGYAYLLVLNVECYEKNTEENIPLEYEGVDIREVGSLKVHDNKFTQNGFLLFEDYYQMEKYHHDNNKNHSPIQNHINNLYIGSIITASIISFIITAFYVYEIYKNNII
jgi:magnesium-transporting ATPase (P-type)